MMVDKVFYSVVLFICTSAMVWAVRKFVTQAIDGMKDALSDVKMDLKAKTKDIKDHFDKTCIERQNACFYSVNERVGRLEKHGHKGLDKNGQPLTFG